MYVFFHTWRLTQLAHTCSQRRRSFNCCIEFQFSFFFVCVVNVDAIFITNNPFFVGIKYRVTVWWELDDLKEFNRSWFLGEVFFSWQKKNTLRFGIFCSLQVLWNLRQVHFLWVKNVLNKKWYFGGEFDGGFF